jgi:hypothetical protein
MGKPRVLITTDIGGGDPDDMQSMAHALLYADKVNYVGFVSSPTGHAGRESNLHDAINAYAKDFARLKTWGDYQDPNYLHSIATQGKITPQPSQGFSSPTEGSQAIIKAAKASSEPLYVLAWGAMTDIAQALHDDPSIKDTVRVISLGAWNTQQDPAARNYVYNNHKDLWWIESNTTQRGMYVDDYGAERNAWKMSDAQGHGALGDYFYNSRPWGLKMGDTPSLLYLLDSADNNNPGAASWGGAYVKNGHGANYWTDNPDPALKIWNYNGAETVQKYQSVIYADMALRFDHAKTAKAGVITAPTTSEPAEVVVQPSTGTSSGTGNPVTATDDCYSIAVNETKYFNARYLTWNDKGADGGLKVTAVDSLTKAGVAINMASDGTIVYRAKAGWQGTDSFDYTLTDANGSTDRGTVFMKVGSGETTTTTTSPTPTPDAPAPAPTGGSGNPVVAGDDFHHIKVGGKNYFDAEYLVLNDKAPDGGLHVTGVDTVSRYGGKVTFNSDGGGVYTPKLGFTGRDSFNYMIADRDGSTDTGTIYVDVLLS